MDASATLSSPAIIRWINDPEVKVSADTQALCSVGEKAFIVFEQEAGSSKGDSWMEIEYAIFFHLAKSCPWAVPGLNFFFSSCHLCLIQPSHLPSILSRKLPSKLISTFTNKYNRNMRGEKNLGLWWIRAVRCFQVSFVFVLLPVRFFVFPATGNNAPAHTVPMVHGYLYRIWPPPDVITVFSLLYTTVSKQPLLTDCSSPSHQDTTDPVETLHVPHCWWPVSSSPGTALLICHWSSSPSSSCFPLPYSADGQIPALPVLTHQPGSLACHCDPCFVSVPCHLDSTVVLPLWLIAMSLDLKLVLSLTVMASSSNVIPTTL